MPRYTFITGFSDHGHHPPTKLIKITQFGRERVAASVAAMEAEL